MNVFFKDITIWFNVYFVIITLTTFFFRSIYVYYFFASFPVSALMFFYLTFKYSAYVKYKRHDLYKRFKSGQMDFKGGELVDLLELFKIEKGLSLDFLILKKNYVAVYYMMHISL